MASDVDACNVALGHLGDSANVASIRPPSGSAQSVHCARLFPLALAEFLECHPWNFNTGRVTSLAEVDNPSTTWLYAFAMPTDAISVISLLPEGATDDYTSSPTVPTLNHPSPQTPFMSTVQPQNYAVEYTDDANLIILCNEPAPILRYRRGITSVIGLPALSVAAVSRLLASKLAGPLIKGKEGRAETVAQITHYLRVDLPAAKMSDAMQRRHTLTHVPEWMLAR